MRPLLPWILVLLAVFAAGEARSQTRLTLSAGGLIPFGELEDTTDPSTRAILRLEFQPVNALGNASTLSYLAYAAYSDLALTSAAEQALIAAGEDTQPYLLELGGAVRVYSRSAPLFLTGGAAYTRYQPGGAADDRNGVDLHAGLGFLFPAGVFLLEPEATGHVVLLDEGDFQFLSATLGIALPF